MNKRSILLFFLAFCLCLPCAPVFADGEDAAGDPVCFVAPEGKQARTAYLTDGDPNTRLSLKKGEELRVEFSEGCAQLFAQLYAPCSFEMALLDADGHVLRSETVACSNYFYSADITGAAACVFRALSADTAFCSVSAYGPHRELPFDVGETATDILVILERPEDILFELGGFLAQYAGECGVSVRPFFLTRGDNAALVHQVLGAIQGMGSGAAPIFADYSLPASGNKARFENAFGGKARFQADLVEIIRSYAPKIIISCGDDAESALHSVIFENVCSAVELAAADTFSADAAPHTVLKYYALDPNGTTVIDFSEPLLHYGNASALERSELAYQLCTEVLVYRRTLPTVLKLSLISSAVGDDLAGDDVLEHIDTSLLTAYTKPTPTPVPTAEPTAAPTPSPLSDDTAAGTTAPADGRFHAAGLSTWLPIALGALLAAVAAGILVKKGALRALPLALLPLAVGAALSLLLAGRAPDALAEPSPTSSPASSPTPLPATPLPEEPPAPTSPPAGDNADRFVEYGSQEIILSDFENGIWQYRGETLAIYIERKTLEYDGNPVVSFIADIYMRDFSSYRSGVRNPCAPHKFGRYEQAVLAITGDNLIRAEKEMKGCLIRSGKFYCDYNAADTLAIHDDMTLSVLSPDEFTAEELIDAGIRDTYSFGPILVRDGRINASCNQHRVAYPNPRCGIGMVEQGHWIAIVTDGRQPGYSYNIGLEDFAQLFLSLGCENAYNLDGGSSAAMVFMGETINCHAGSGTRDPMRSWTDALMWGWSDQLPPVDEPTKHNGYHY